MVSLAAFYYSFNIEVLSQGSISCVQSFFNCPSQVGADNSKGLILRSKRLPRTKFMQTLSYTVARLPLGMLPRVVW